MSALLVYLAIEADRAHRRTALADLLWPDHDEAAARHNLSQALFNLRRAVRDDSTTPLLLTTRESVCLNPNYPIWLDLRVFHELLRGDIHASTAQFRKASALYRGELLEGWNIGNSVVFEEWLLATREQMHRCACDVLRQLTAPGVLNDADELCEYARRWITLDPLCEEAYRRLMRALTDSGQRTAALCAVRSLLPHAPG